MWLTLLIAAALSLAGIVAGYRPWFHLDQINARRVLNGLLIALLLFTLLMVAGAAGLLPDPISACIMASLYAVLFGFFTGYGVRILRLRDRAGRILYMVRSFWIDHAPGLAAIVLILFGLYRTSLLLDQPVTPIRLTSGLSLIAVGFFTLTLKAIPEFRTGGILFLDRLTPWKKIISWRWESEDVIRIEYIHRPGTPEEQIRFLLTSIPPDEKKRIESVLRSEMARSDEERQKLLRSDSLPDERSGSNGEA